MSSVALDMDDVIIDFVGSLCTAINLEAGTDLRVEDVTDWDMSSVLNAALGEDWWGWLQKRAWLWPTFPPMPGAFATIAAWRRQGIYCEVVTAKPEWAEWVVWKWFGNWRPPVQRITVVPIGAHKSKYSRADLLVDDRPENVLEWLDSDRPALLFERPWNKHMSGPMNAVVGWNRLALRVPKVLSLYEGGELWHYPTTSKS